jgi:hypothetical protein
MTMSTERGRTRVQRLAALTELALALVLIATLAGCKKKAESRPQVSQVALPASTEQRIERNPDRNAYFGEEHIHTSWSLDAWVMGNRITGPNDALKYAQGQTIKHPMGYDIKIDTPMDFMGVTDHSEYVGVTRQANTPGSYVSKLPEAQPLIMKDPNNQEEQQKVFLYLLALTSKPPIKAFMSPQVAEPVWKENVKIAEENNHPGQFTAFCSYEWTSMPNNRNLHRNIFFRDCNHVPDMPFSSMDDAHPEALWNWMDTQRKAGNELLAISHNANVSDGWMYPTDLDSYGRPIDAAWAASRDRNERLVEIKQIKGQSETHPLLSPNDEFANYEIFSGLLGLPVGVGRVDHIQGSYARQALKDGITMQDVRGYNPYKLGMAGGSDSHNTGSPYRQDNFFGGHADADGTVERRLAGAMLGNTIDVRLENPGGLTGVWAEENTRQSLWDAMYRKETFGTSGVHIKVRFFGSWSYSNNIFNGKDWVHKSYGSGVPMGADLPTMPSDGEATAPTFVIWAAKDPASANLDRLQVIKGWTQNGQSFEKVFDVAWAGDRKKDKWTGLVPAITSTVDLVKATYTNDKGSIELKTVWTDPEFNASLHAFYYARVLEIPTPRWTLMQAVKAGVPPPDTVPLTGQERAWTSPIWYTPTADARKNAPAGTTVTGLTKNGATQLSDAQLKALIVGKSLWIRDNVTGEQFSANFTAEGHWTIFHVGRYAIVPSGFGQVGSDGYQGTTNSYEISGGRLLTFVSQEPYSYTIYKAGSTYYLARSNEFGYANYEIVPLPSPPVVANPMTAVLNQFSMELGLTEDQRKQILPVIKEEVPQLQALKKNTSLSPLEKLKKVRLVSEELDSKITPVLDHQQQQKFQQIRDEHRRKLIEQMAGQILEKAETDVSRAFANDVHK